MGEIKEFKLPETSENVQESLVVLWYKEEGDFIKSGENLLEIQTEKAVFEIESPYTGILKKILIKRGESVSVDQVLATIELKEKEAESKGSVKIEKPEFEKAVKRPVPKSAAVKASPRVRKIARDLGIDLTLVKGSGPEGRIIEDDLKKYNETKKIPAESSEEDFKLLHLSNIRSTTASKMTESLKNTAQLTETAWGDVTNLAQKRKGLAPDLSWTDWILKAVISALQENPILNSTLIEKGIKIFKHINLGAAVNVEEGLFVPVIKNAEMLSLKELHSALVEAVKKTKESKLTKEDISGGTFTVTNLGNFGIQFFTPIINYPEAAILGIGKVETHVAMHEGKLIEILRLPLSLTFDHRIIDGVPAAKFLQSVSKFLSEPEKLLLK